eukprot:624115-Rhodomonas_salina.2
MLSRAPAHLIRARSLILSHALAHPLSPSPTHPAALSLIIIIITLPRHRASSPPQPLILNPSSSIPHPQPAPRSPLTSHHHHHPPSSSLNPLSSTRITLSRSPALRKSPHTSSGSGWPRAAECPTTASARRSAGS